MKKILILSSRIPYPLIGGDRIRIYNTGKILSGRYRVDLACIGEGRVPNGYIKGLKKTFHKVILFSYPHLRFRWNAFKGIFSSEPLQAHYYYFREVQNWIDKNFRSYDLIFGHHIRTARYMEHIDHPKVVDLHDAISMNYLKAVKKANGLWRLIYGIENRRVLPYEIKTINCFNRSFIVSDVDRNYLIEHGAKPEKISTIPVAVKDEVVKRASQVREKDQIAFLGKMNYVSNEDAVMYFARKVFPILRRIDHRLRFVIIGAHPTKAVLDLEKIEGIAVTGFMKDPYPVFEASKVVVAPLRFGAGIQNKILEAMALRKPVVTTSLGAQGIKGKNGEHFLVADGAEEMTEKTLSLLKDRKKRKSMGKKARALIEKEYTWDIVGEKFLMEIGQII
jgi:sugar transferase (PEP-CTERM/EpsH1 system associated)